MYYKYAVRQYFPKNWAFSGRYIKCRYSISAIGRKSPVKICFTAFVHYGNSTAVQYTSEVSKQFASFSASKWMLNQRVIQKYDMEQSPDNATMQTLYNAIK